MVTMGRPLFANLFEHLLNLWEKMLFKVNCKSTRGVWQFYVMQLILQEWGSMRIMHLWIDYILVVHPRRTQCKISTFYHLHENGPP